MSDTAFPRTAAADTGLVAADRLGRLPHTTRGELALGLGVSRDSTAKTARAAAPATRARLRDMVEILNRATPWSGSPQQAFAPGTGPGPYPPSATRPPKPWSRRDGPKR